MRISTELALQSFYPPELEVANICQTDTEIHIKMFARSKSCTCPKCGIVSTHRHGTYERKLQDFPILGKFTWLFVHAYEYQCDNPDCDITCIHVLKEGWTYLAAVMDLCSRKIIGYAYGMSMTAELAVEAVKNACLNVRNTRGDHTSQ